MADVDKQTWTLIPQNFMDLISRHFWFYSSDPDFVQHMKSTFGVNLRRQPDQDFSLTSFVNWEIEMTDSELTMFRLSFEPV